MMKMNGNTGLPAFSILMASLGRPSLFHEAMIASSMRRVSALAPG